jgi:hypothetical protein
MGIRDRFQRRDAKAPSCKAATRRAIGKPEMDGEASA